MRFYFLLNIVIISRLFYGFKNEAISPKRLGYIILSQILLLSLFRFTAALFILIFLFISLDTAVYFLERKVKNINGFRIATFALYFLLAGLFTSSRGGLEFNGQISGSLYGIAKLFYIPDEFRNINLLRVNLISAAVLFLLNESNYLIRFFFELFSLTPMQKISGETVELDIREYNAGRIIGMLERILIFLFLLENQYAAIGFIIAAKGFTRFKELDDRNFAEYVLIGTFLSALTAIAVTLIVKIIIRP